MTLIMPGNVWNVLTMPGVWTYLIILDIWKDFECASYIKWARVMNMPRYSYYNIIAIFVTNVIILEFPPAWFVHPGAPQLTILSLFNTS